MAGTETRSEQRFQRDNDAERPGGRGPDGPTDLGTRSWWGVLKRTVSAFRADNLTDWAAALTYYGIQAVFPALLVLVSLVGLAGKSATDSTMRVGW